MCSLRFENNLLTFEGVRFASISKKTPLSKLSFAFVSLALPLLIPTWFLAPIDCLKIPALDFQLAAAVHPRFCLMWLQKHDPDRASAVKEAMELQVEACMKEEDEVAAANYCYQIAYTELKPI